MSVPKAKNHKHHQHQVTLNIEKGMDEKVLIGQIAEIPSITVQADSKLELRKAALTAIKGYFKAFPDEHDKIFHHKVVRREKITLEV